MKYYINEINKNGTIAAEGLHKYGNDYYCVFWDGTIRTNGRYFVKTSYCDLAGNKNYTFDANGKVLDGIVEIDGVLYYYKDGTSPAPGLIYLDGHYYYVYWDGKLIVNRTFYVSETNGYTIRMNYTFDETGKVVL